MGLIVWKLPPLWWSELLVMSLLSLALILTVAGNREKKAGDNAGRGTGGLVDNATIANFGLADAGIVAGDSGIDIFD